MTPGIDHTGITIVFWCHDGRGNVVMQKRGAQARDERGRWDIGGGGLELGERVEECLRKEVREEYGVDCEEIKFLGFREVFREHEGKQTHWIALDHKVLVDRDKVYRAEPHKFDELGWFTPETMPEPLHLVMPLFINKYREKLL